MVHGFQPLGKIYDFKFTHVGKCIVADALQSGRQYCFNYIGHFVECFVSDVCDSLAHDNFCHGFTDPRRQRDFIFRVIVSIPLTEKIIHFSLALNIEDVSVQMPCDTAAADAALGFVCKHLQRQHLQDHHTAQ